MTTRSRMLQVLVGLGIVAGLEAGLRALSTVPDVDYYELYRLHGADGFAMLDQGDMAVPLLNGVSELFDLDRTLLWQLRPSMTVGSDRLLLGSGASWTVTTNAQGFRDDETPLADWVAVGDSCTFGWGVDRPWPDRLESRTGQRISNLAVPGYSSAQGEASLAVLDVRETDVLFATFGANDGHMVAMGDAEAMGRRETAVGGLRYQVAQLHLVQHARAWLYPWWGRGTVLAWQAGQYRPRVTPDELRANLEAMAQRTRRLVLVDVCARDEYVAELDGLAESSPAVDILHYTDVHGDTLDGCHPTVEGHIALADALAALLGATG